MSDDSKFIPQEIDIARLKAHLHSVVVNTFHPMAQIAVVTGWRALVLVISWELSTDCSPRKRSKSIRLTIENEAIDDYVSATERHRGMADARLAYHLTERLSNFNPAHETPTGLEPPMVRWLVGTSTLLG